LAEVFATNSRIRKDVGKALQSGIVRRIRPGLYTTNLNDPIEVVVKRNLWPILAQVSPGAVISHRTALEMRPMASGTVFVTGSYGRVISNVPGIKIRQIAGPGPLKGDTAFVHGLTLASQGRALLECLGGVPRGTATPFLSQGEVESILDRMLVAGENRLNQVRDMARFVAPSLGADPAFERLDTLIGAMLGTRQANFVNPKAIGRMAARPYDASRIALFQALLEEFATWPAVDRPDSVITGPPFANISFFDAYFSNFIEGTEFEVDEALDIVFQNRIPRSRPEDAHDVLGTYSVVGNATEMGRQVSSLSTDLFLRLLRGWHSSILSARPDKRPGQFKEVANRAGSTKFVEPAMVEGTIRLGFEMGRTIATPFGRAAFLMFLIAEVHPFDDGNGRLARAVMNAELVAFGQRRIIVPTVFRVEYIDALKKLSNEGRPRLFARMLDAAQEFCADVDFTTLESSRLDLNEWNAFDTDPDSRLRRQTGKRV
jgi:hypothetical protein